ncbi:MAG: ROK family protein [Actinobacteria bacterium]|nr:ROK family protein [Actinomycetota bacterium]MCL5445993.1 ROK family protein [Actinomycetota bacterium]
MPDSDELSHPFTLGVDIGGSGLKAAVLDARARMVTEKLRIETPYPLSPERLVDSLASMAGKLVEYDRVSVGFNGMVRHGIVITAPQFSRIGGLGTPIDKDLVTAWHNFDLANALEDVLGKPTRVANDADVQGAAVVEGKGLELVVTLGTGCGTALFYNGGLLPHMEFAHHPLHGDETYNDYVGDSALREVGEHKWTKRVLRTLDILRNLVFFDKCFVGGGNAKKLTMELPPDCVIIDNSAGILGGVRLWDTGHLGVVDTL